MARSAVTAMRVARSSSRATSARVVASSPRVTTPIAPCATAGSKASGARIASSGTVMSRRRKPASASRVASSSPASSLASRVPTLPRSSTISRSGLWCSSWAWRRTAAVPTIAPRGRSAIRRIAPSRDATIRTSRGSARGSNAAIARAGGSQVGTSFIECTARSMRSSSSASSSSLVNRPLPPMSASARSRTWSPELRIATISSPSGSAPAPISPARTWFAWIRASGLPRVPMRRVGEGAMRAF